MQVQRISKSAVLVYELLAVLVWLAVTIFFSVYLEAFTFWWNVFLIPAAVLFLFFSIYFIPKWYQNTVYSVTDTEVVLHSGVLFHRQQVMARRSIVYVTLNRSPLTPIFRIGSVSIRATGATIRLRSLPISQAERVVKELTPKNEL